MPLIEHPDSLCIHPERLNPRHERGAFEVPGHTGGWRQWLVYDSQGTIRIDHGMHDRDVDDGLVARLEADLDALEERDEEHKS